MKGLIFATGLHKVKICATLLHYKPNPSMIPSISLFPLRTALAVVFSSVLLFSCGKEDADQEKPVITVLKPASDHADAHPGDSLELSASFSDNKELLNARIEIHSADGHSHRLLSPSSTWEWVKVYPLSGTNAPINEIIVIPASIDTGEYHIIFEATDKSGNQAVEVIKELHIEEH